MFKSIFICLFISLFFSCGKAPQEPYSFFVAGHLYGSVWKNYNGVHPPFKAKIDFLNNLSDLKFGVLTGDIVKDATAEQWSAAMRDISSIKTSIHLARGNHDYKDTLLLEKNFPKSYYKFLHGADLHIILDGNLDGWNISGDQLTFLTNTINEYKHSISNIFIYCHQAIWYNRDQNPKAVRVNSEFGRHPESTFLKDVAPLLTSLETPVYLFAGDVGALDHASDVSYEKLDNIHLLSSGMGDDTNDNFLLVSIDKLGAVSIRIIPLNSENMNSMGLIDDYLN